MVFHILGSCSGTEPMPHRHHTSITLEIGSRLYFLDAGESCAYSSYLLGIPQLNTRSIFISHTHMDHIGGLPHLLWNLRKLCTLSPENAAKMEGRIVDVYLPDLQVFEGIRQMLLGSEGNYETNFSLVPHRIEDGTVLDDGTLQVEAIHNHHLGTPEPGQPWKSFSLRLTAQGKRIFYSGDFKDLAPLLPHLAGCDFVMLETGHHRAFQLCQELKNASIHVPRLLFVHHGMEILRDFQGELKLAREVWGEGISFAEDGMRIEI